MMKKNFVTLKKVGESLAKIPGMPELIQRERASVRAALFVESVRKEARLSQSALAEMLGISQARVSQMENGEGRYGLSVAVLQNVAEACGGELQLAFKKADISEDARAGN